jgi:hypothetical protein
MAEEDLHESQLTDSAYAIFVRLIFSNADPGDPAFLHRELTEEELRLLAQARARDKRHQAEIAEAVRRFKSREEQLDVLATELRAHGREVPPRPYLDVRLDRIIHPDKERSNELETNLHEWAQNLLKGMRDLAADESAEMVIESAASDALAPRASSRPKRKTTKRRPRKATHRRAPPHFYLPDFHKTIEVRLDEEVADFLMEIPEFRVDDELRQIALIGPMASLRELFSPDVTPIIGLRLWRTKELGIEVRAAGRRLGVIRDQEVGPFLPHFRRGARLQASGVRYVDHDGGVHLWLSVPRP